ncbi:hypothetical protein [Pseudoalteromonas prydzensis]|uniref:hypothetical protein n=1 Tax=Pseudoalteromonas prydzensis TaxID=182141 RepID=UPI0037038C37
MFLTELFGVFSLSALVVWGFLMAFFFNIFIFSLGIKRNTTLLLSSFFMALSYLIGDHFFTWLSPTPATYLDWAIYDIVTLGLLGVIFFFIRKTTPSFIYLISGLTLNITFFIFMYIDLYVYRNTSPWLLWDVYSFGVNIVDFTMIVALIVDRDILGLIKLKNGIKALFKGQQVKHTA